MLCCKILYLDVFFEIPWAEQCLTGSFVFPYRGFLLVIITNITIIIFTNAISLSSFHHHHVLYLKQSYGPFVFPCHGFLSVSSTRTTSRAFSSVLSSSRASASPKKLKQLCLCISKNAALMYLWKIVAVLPKKHNYGSPKKSCSRIMARTNPTPSFWRKKSAK